MRKMLTSVGSGSAVSILLVTLLSIIPIALQATPIGSYPGSENLTGTEPADPRLLETANVSGTSENLTGTEPADPRLLETANVSGTSENLTGTEPADPRLFETP
jgi:predicted RNA-binding protein with PUA domain